MKKYTSKVSIAFVCALLGFMITYQFKIVNNKSGEENLNKNNADIILQNDQLTKQKDEYAEKLEEVEKKLNQYETAAASKDDEGKVLLEQLEMLRNVNGSTDLIGEGITVYITPKAVLLNGTPQGHYIQDLDLVDIVNELYAGQAEAMSINDIRLRARSGIRTAGNAIVINNLRIDPNKQVVIKAIGNKVLLEAAISFAGNIPELLTKTCDIKWELSDAVKISKSSIPVEEFKYAKPIDK
ncbi:MAG: DUF881 domain-containing protein [Clostridium sp.]